ncbi:hypothetical protein WICPIJ_004381 [Wickerhamomyces pijperi]|uniref:Exonuclease domain-containing protein n=1 Tax=Wickerhamomyces pijperi TaxID=599730 RepID=A0A9P8Q809_WICPI|nr:hypothetical protein WICPIJ_004381 [Wickerhamomyces pijperi]
MKSMLNHFSKMFRPSLTIFKTITCPKVQNGNNNCSLLQCPFLHTSTAIKRPLSSTSSTEAPPNKDSFLIKRPRSDTLVLIPKSFAQGGFPPSPVHQRLTYLSALSAAFKEQGIPQPNKNAIEKEFEIAQKSSKLVYDSNMKKFIRSVKKGEFKLDQEEEKEKRKKKKKDETKEISESLNSLDEYNKLKKLVHSEQVLLKENFITSIPETRSDPTLASRVCNRCKTSFQGKNQTNTSCSFHERKKYKSSSNAKHWECCDQIVGESQGCKSADFHVFKVSTAQELHDLIPFVKTPSFKHKLENKHKMIGLDCEMGYTTKGLELIRLTIVDYLDPKVTLFDELIKPSGKILDLNTLWSGVTSIPDNAKTLNQLHKELFEGSSDGKKQALITDETVIVGHGLENDLNALRIVHPLVVDSSLLYPKGLDWKYSLKDLSMLINGVNIQSGNAGHSSEEDSIAAINVIKGYINGVRLQT